MFLLTNNPVSPAGKVNPADIRSWLNNLFIFTLGVVSIYVVSVIGILEQPNHLISLKDFVPNVFVLGAITLYIFQGVQNLIRKFTNPN
jgi:hypothetical protein